MTRVAPRPRAAALIAIAAALASCAPPGTVVLLPEPDGHPTAVSVRQGGQEVLLDRPYAGVKSQPLGANPYRSSPAEVQAQFAAALAAQPMRLEHFIVYFVPGRDELTPESMPSVEAMFAAIARHPIPDILVVGHTDTVGSDEVNDRLGQQRADVVRNALIARGVAPENIRAISRGKRDLLKPTDDNVAEPANRRVEIVVR